MRQTHIAGERVFIDYAGTTIDIFEAETGEVHACQPFVAVLGAKQTHRRAIGPQIHGLT